jgi:hypothetical protein
LRAGGEAAARTQGAAEADVRLGLERIRLGRAEEAASAKAGSSHLVGHHK